MKEKMNDTFYRATQALKKLPDIYGGSSNRLPPTKITDDHIRQIHELIKAGQTKAEVARSVGLAPSTVYNAVRRLERSGVL